VKLKPVKLAPALIAVCVITLVCVLRLLQPDLLERPELMTYDWRVRQALKFAPPAATNLGFVYISDDTIDKISRGSLNGKPFGPFGLYWPRHIYGRLIRELSTQNAKVVGVDVIFGERRPDQPTVSLSVGKLPEATTFISALYPGETPTIVSDDQGEKWMTVQSDDYFAWQLHRANIAVLASDKGVRPNRLFATNALGVADISAVRDADGVLRRVKAFQTYTNWHYAFQKIEDDPDFGVNLRRARIEGTNIVLPRVQGLEPIVIPVDADNNFDLRDLIGDKLPPGISPRAKAFTQERIWHMGIVLAAQELKLDLTNAEVNLAAGRIRLHGAGGVERTFAVDKDGFFFINWEVPYTDPFVTKEPMENLLIKDMERSAGVTNSLPDRWKNKLAIVGSVAIGNDLTDLGATPLEKDTFLVSAHWNVANSILNGRFVQRSSLAADLLLIILMGIAAALLTWELRALVSSCALAALFGGYSILSVVLYVQHRYWLPLVYPLGGGLLVMHVCLVTWRVVFEQAEQRRVKSIFSTVVSPKIMTELLKAERLSLGGARREVTVLFADVRGFTEFTDTTQEQATQFVAANKLSDDEAETYYDESARETLATVNLYLGIIADTIVKHDATLDKFIGDCVMAFWGAPVPTSDHAVASVRAAIDAQRAIFELNKQRAEENKLRETENRARLSVGLEPKPPLPLLLLGTGINTGSATVGLMGSETKAGVRQGNYTVFGREVNLASRLEGLSGRGRIFISEATHKILLRDDPALAATCIAQSPQKAKGFSMAINVYEVPWRPPGSAPPDEPAAPAKPAAENPAPH
jgi:class 3 adenylate cyclase/CHASE2 domain-containing sensor protein